MGYVQLYTNIEEKVQSRSSPTHRSSYVREASIVMSYRSREMSKCTTAPATDTRADELTSIIDERLPDLMITSILIIIEQDFAAELRTRFVKRRQAAISLQAIPRKVGKDVVGNNLQARIPRSATPRQSNEGL